MNKEEKIKTFETELNFIVSSQIRLFAEKIIEIMPDYFWQVPASSSGKYHPEYATGNGGLYRHTKAAVRIAIELFRTDLWNFTGDEKDLIIVGLIIHDGFKSGKNQERYSRADHPNIMAFEVSHNNDLLDVVSPEQMQFLSENVARHMGKWVEDYLTKQKILNAPETESQKFTHLCDYIASRKCLEFNFDAGISKD